MAAHNEFGQEAEELAAAWLIEHGYEIIQRNWTYGKLEIDIVATKRDFLHFIEVKALNQPFIGHPEDSVTKGKFKKLQRAAHEYIFQNPGHDWIQYDILAITFFNDKEPEYFLIEDVFLR